MKRARVSGAGSETVAAGRPLVSVIIPARNPGRYLAEAVESVSSQTYPSVELVVVDDGSSEDLDALADLSRARRITQPNRGVAAARNRGAEESRGDYLVFLDADDRLLPRAVEDGVAALARQARAAFAAGLCNVIDAEGGPMPFTQRGDVTGDYYLEMLRGNYIWMPAQVVYRRYPFFAAGGFDPSVSACADYDLYLRITRVDLIACHRSVVAQYRRHDRCMSADAALMLRSSLCALGRQWPHVRGDADRRRAYRIGRRFWREWYGDRLVEQVRANLRPEGDLRLAARAAACLIRYHPASAARQLGRKARCLALDLAAGTRRTIARPSSNSDLR